MSVLANVILVGVILVWAMAIAYYIGSQAR